MAKTIMLSVDDILYDKFKENTRMGNRSLSNFIKKATVQYIESKMLADDFEMEEIRNNSDFQKRIRAGSRDAAKRRGRFVE